MFQTEKYSGAIIHQNQAPENDNDIYPLVESWVYQEFALPDNYQRGGYIPDLTGAQLTVQVEEGWASAASLDYKLEHQVFGVGWEELTSGIMIGCVTDGMITCNLYFNLPVELNESNLEEKFRVGVKGRVTGSSDLKVPASYDGRTIIFRDNQYTPIFLDEGVPYPITIGGEEGFFLKDDQENVTFSVQRGVQGIYYSVPNPLAQHGVRAKDAADNPIRDTGRDVSFLFHVFANTADEGTDFLGNVYRSVVFRSKGDNVSTLNGGLANSFWMSKPNPSKFAVEARYFDMRGNDGRPTVIDRFLADPLTPGVYASLYYSNDGDPGTTEFEWSNKLWTRVPQTYHLTQRNTYALPNPVTAKYLCLEFTHLLEKSYAPGDLVKPITYKKHPKWVLDYFILRTDVDLDSQDPFPSRSVTVNYDAYDLAYNYYLDDLSEDPLTPEELGFTADNDLNRFLTTRTDASDQVDSTMLGQINLLFNYYRTHITEQGKLDFLLTGYMAETAVTGTGNPAIPPPNGAEVPGAVPVMDTTVVSSLNRNSIVYEKQMPVMFYFINCRHFYREVKAHFQHDHAYFVGLKELAFYRDQYSVPFDNPLYIESGGDTVSSERNDFDSVDGILRTYDDTH